MWLFTLFFSICFAIPNFLCAGYVRQPVVSEEAWEALEPYFLPEDHRIKKRLDEIFSKAGVTTNENTLLQAKFKHIKVRPVSHIVFAKHKKLKGYVIKTFLEDGPEVNEWGKWKSRIEGAETIRRLIAADAEYAVIFKVPRKWVYPLPRPSGKINFILIAEDMDIYPHKHNMRKWKTTSITPIKLKAFFRLIEQAGLSDSVLAFNVPFTRDGKLAFIDTEYHHRWPVKYEKTLRFLAPRMQMYWNTLMADMPRKLVSEEEKQ